MQYIFLRVHPLLQVWNLPQEFLVSTESIKITKLFFVSFIKHVGIPSPVPLDIFYALIIKKASCVSISLICYHSILSPCLDHHWLQPALQPGNPAAPRTRSGHPPGCSQWALNSCHVDTINKVFKLGRKVGDLYFRIVLETHFGA